MTHTFFSAVFTLLALAVACFAFLRLLKKKSLWYVLSIFAAVLAAAAFWFAWPLGFFLLIPAALLFALATFYKKA